jgi:putative phosphoribosyl transferase
MKFKDRQDAGAKLATRLLTNDLIRSRDPQQLIILSIPRGGVVVGAVVAQRLGCAHDVIVARKIGFPGHAEMAIGALAEEGQMILAPEFANWPPLKGYLADEIERTQARIESDVKKFRPDRPLKLVSKTVILVDDGIATGETMKAAALAVKSGHFAGRPQQLIIAVPVCSPGSLAEVAAYADTVVCLSTPAHFLAVGQYYQAFDQVDDDVVVAYLASPSLREAA